MASKTKPKPKRKGKAKAKAVKAAKDFPPHVLLKIFNGRPLNEIVWLTDHAIERYQERFRPGFSLAQATKELYKRMNRDGRFVVEAPSWIGRQLGMNYEGDTIGYVTIDDDLALPVIDKKRMVNRFIVPTCLYYWQP